MTDVFAPPVTHWRDVSWRDVSWRDLIAYRPWEIIRELTLPLPWLALALWAGSEGLIGLMAVAAAFVFMLGLRIAHNSFHSALGISTLATDCVMFLLSVMMIGSMHAIQYTHTYHHKHCMEAGDIEGHVATMGFWEALLKGPLYPFYIHHAALKYGSAKQKRWICAELFFSAVGQIVIWSGSTMHGLAGFSIMMIFANAIAPLVGIWAVHQACEGDGLLARTSRRPWLNRLSFGMFYHLEHHLYPAVPTCHLAVLARRLDQAGFAEYKQVF
ncbi:MAG: fatty acid desaturase [Pseudomonadota bacterium]